MAFERTLGGFEQGLKRTFDLFGLSAWACVFPPSFQAGGRPLFIAQGVNAAKSTLLAKASKEGLEAVLGEKESVEPVLLVLAKEIAPSQNSRCRVLRITRDGRGSDLIIFCYRAAEQPDFRQEELQLLSQAGRLLDRCFLSLAEQQHQEFMVGLFRLVSNLHSEGLCILDNRLRVLFENRKFREHMHVWNHGQAESQNLTLPRQSELPQAWKEACDRSFAALREVSFPPSTSRMVVTQGPVSKLRFSLSSTEYIEGAVRYLALQGSLGVRPYMMLTSSVRTEQVSGPVSLAKIAEALAFSRRESQLAELILRGASAQEIASRLRISVPTVKTHIRNILRKAGVKTRLQFVGLCRNAR